MILQADARHIPLRNGSVHCVVTSPPYWGLRDYGLNGKGIGLEATPEEYTEKLIGVFREVRRVLRDDGTVWLNLGDSYAANRSYQVRDNKHVDVGNAMASSVPLGLKPKDLVGIPWRVAFALQADGWWLRRDIIWAKGASFGPFHGNPMPESTDDRPSSAHEYLFLLAKSKRYFYDKYAVIEPSASGPSDVRKMVEHRERIGGLHKELDDPLQKANATTNIGRHRAVGSPAGRNLRSVWTIASQPYPESHFATFPPRLVEPCILAGTSAKGCCPECGASWWRALEKQSHTLPVDERHGRQALAGPPQQSGWFWRPATITAEAWRPACEHRHDPIPCTVFDPFCGSGTTVAIAERLGRRGLGLDLKWEYLLLARKRIQKAGLGLPLA